MGFASSPKLASRVEEKTRILNRIKIVFFDVGNIFVSDDLSGAYCYDRLYGEFCKRRPVSVQEFFRLREEHVRSGGNLWTFAQWCLPDGELPSFQERVRGEIYSRWLEFSPEIEGVADAVRKLREKYRLGIIANQPAAAEDVLRERGLLDLFEVRAISESLGVEKPNPEIFEWALREAGVEPGEALMVGDRIDNDIRPAKALGMRTLWLRMGFERRGWKPETEFQKAYAETLAAFNFCEQEPESPEETPDFFAESPQDLVRILTP